MEMAKLFIITRKNVFSLTELGSFLKIWRNSALKMFSKERTRKIHILRSFFFQFFVYFAQLTLFIS